MNWNMNCCVRLLHSIAYLLSFFFHSTFGISWIIPDFFCSDVPKFCCDVFVLLFCIQFRNPWIWSNQISWKRTSFRIYVRCVNNTIQIYRPGSMWQSILCRCIKKNSFHKSIFKYLWNCAENLVALRKSSSRFVLVNTLCALAYTQKKI